MNGYGSTLDLVLRELFWHYGFPSFNMRTDDMEQEEIYTVWDRKGLHVFNVPRVLTLDEKVQLIKVNLMLLAEPDLVYQ